MHLINIVEEVTLSRDAKADALLDPLFMEGEMAGPVVYCDTLPQVPDAPLHPVSQGKCI